MTSPVLIVYSTKDPAGLNIKTQLIEDFHFQKTEANYQDLPIYELGNLKLIGVQTHIIETETLADSFKGDFALFASKHVSESGEPAFTVHTTGLTHEYAHHETPQPLLAWAYPQKMKIALIHLLHNREKFGLENYKVSFEATHHSPVSLPYPVVFVEIGSREENWQDPTSGKLVAGAIMAAASTDITDEGAVGFGGGHYAPKQTRVTTETRVAVGHTIAKYALEEFDESLFKAALEKTRGGCRKVVIDWKGVRGEVRRGLEEAASTWGVEVIRV